MTKETLSTCLLCGQDKKFKLVQRCADWSHPKDELFEYVMCPNCGLVFQNPRPTREYIKHYYYDDDISYLPETYNAISKFFVKMRTRREISGYNNLLGKKTGVRVIEIGSSYGSYLKLLKDYGGYEVLGIEFNEQAALLGRKLYDIKILSKPIYDIEIVPKSFDIVILRHVLEHFHDPDFVLKFANKVLKDGGLLVIDVPAFKTWESKMFSRYWVGWEAPRHLFAYTQDTLSMFLRKHHFQIKDVKYGGVPNQFIMSIRNYLSSHTYPNTLKNFFNLKNNMLLLLFTPVAITMSILNQSGRFRMVGIKQEL